MINQPSQRVIRALIRNAKIVSFDMFDTLVKRIVTDDDELYGMVAQVAQGTLHISIPEFTRKRKTAQHLASMLGERKHPNIDDIYSYIDYEESLQNKLKKIELMLHKRVCYPNPEIKRLFEYTLKLGKRIIVTSDMYLPASVLEEILLSCGYLKIEKIFVSCEMDGTKRSGDIFDKVNNSLRIKPTEILHIGDAKRGDVAEPIKHHWRAFHYRTVHNNTIPWANKLAEFTVDKTESIGYQYGYTLLGPLLYSFTQWLSAELKKLPGNTAPFFLAREGKLLMEAYNIFKRGDCNHLAQAHYLYVSRKSTVVPSLLRRNTMLDPQVLRDQRFAGRIVSYYDFLEESGFNPAEIKTICKRFGKHTYDLVPEIIPKDFSNSIKNELSIYAKRQQDLLTRYLKDEGFVKNIAVIDIGWRGSMQHALCNISRESNTTISGFYLGVSKETLHDGPLTMRGCIFDRNNGTEFEEMLTGFRGLLEELFIATHGSTLRYEENETTHTIEPLLDNEEKYSRQNQEFIENFQHGALKFVEYLCADTFLSSLAVSPRSAFRIIAHTFLCPTSKILSIFGKLQVYGHGQAKAMISKKEIRQIEPLHRKIERFLGSPWRVGFLKALLRININYEEFYYFLRKCSHK